MFVYSKTFISLVQQIKKTNSLLKNTNYETN